MDNVNLRIFSIFKHLPDMSDIQGITISVTVQSSRMQTFDYSFIRTQYNLTQSSQLA